MAMTLVKPTEDKAGYKKTELGWIPTDWNIISLGEILEVKHGHAFKSEFFSDSGSYIVLTPGNFFEDGGFKLRPEKDRYYSTDDFPKDYLLQKGDVIIAMTEQADGLLGSSAYIPKSNVYLHNQRLGLIVEKQENSIDKKFIYYLFNIKNIRKQIKISAAGTKVKHTSPERIGNVLAAFPKLVKEQSKIALILEPWDEAISKTEALIAAKARLKREVTKKLFNAAIKNSPKKVLSDVFVRMTDKNAEGNTNVLTISGQDGLISQSKFFNKRVAAEEVSGYYLLKKGDFAYNKSYSNGYPMGAIKRLNLYESGIVSSLYICFRLKEDTSFNSDYFEHFFEYGGLNREIQMIAQEGARNHGLLNIGVQDFFNIQIPVPDYKTQTEIAFVLNLLEQEFQLLKLYLDKLKTQKQGLMQQLLTGKVRVKI